MRVEVYRNLHKNCWSIRNLKTGRVVRHSNEVFIEDAKFVVQPAGREKVLREKKKNVHAFVRGNWLPYKPHKISKTFLPNTYSYNPYKFNHFYNIETEERIDSSPFVMLDILGHVRG